MAGERRLRACKLARMETIPAILCDCGDQRTAALGLLENIQREDLNPFEQAQGLRDVIALWDCTQAEAAKRLGMAQPTLANKLRLLQLTTDQRQFVLDNGLTERHARAVLRLPENRRSEALITIAKRRMNARQTDLYIEQLLNAAAPGRHRISMVKDAAAQVPSASENAALAAGERGAALKSKTAARAAAQKRCFITINLLAQKRSTALYQTRRKSTIKKPESGENLRTKFLKTGDESDLF